MQVGVIGNIEVRTPVQIACYEREPMHLIISLAFNIARTATQTQVFASCLLPYWITLIRAPR